MKISKSITLAAMLVSAISFADMANAQAAQPIKAKNVVLVHGAWADGSSWAKVIPILQAAGLHVTSVQNPLTSLDDDVAATRRALALQDGPTVLVGHSYAGSVITEAGVDPKVTSLVYVAARAPDAGEDFVALAAKFPSMPVRAGAIDHDGYVSLTEDAYTKYFGGDLPRDEAEALFATQQPIAKTLFTGRTTVAAWHIKPSWYAVSKQDQTTNPDLERFLAKRMHATTREIDSSHLSLVSHPQEIANMILEAAGVTK